MNEEGLQYKVWIVGDGEDRPKLERYIEENSLENISLLGKQGNPFAYMAQADWLLCVSRHEGFNMVLHEAIYCGVPVITTINAGTEELLGQSQYGIVLDNTDAAIEEGMRRVLQDNSLREKYSLAAQERKSFISLDERITQIYRFLS